MERNMVEIPDQIKNDPHYLALCEEDKQKLHETIKTFHKSSDYDKNMFVAMASLLATMTADNPISYKNDCLKKIVSYIVVSARIDALELVMTHSPNKASLAVSILKLFEKQDTIKNQMLNLMEGLVAPEKKENENG